MKFVYYPFSISEVVTGDWFYTFYPETPRVWIDIFHWLFIRKLFEWMTLFTHFRGEMGKGTCIPKKCMIVYYVNVNNSVNLLHHLFLQYLHASLNIFRVQNFKQTCNETHLLGPDSFYTCPYPLAGAPALKRAPFLCRPYSPCIFLS